MIDDYFIIRDYIILYYTMFHFPFYRNEYSI